MTFLAKSAVLALVLSHLAGCSKSEPTKPAKPAASVATEVSVQPGTRDVELLKLLDSCEVAHRGLAIDLGSAAAETQRTFSQAFDGDVAPVEHGGGSFAKVESRRIDYDFWLSEPRSELYVSTRVRGRRAGRMAAYLDGRRLGGARLSPGEARIATFRSRDQELAQGRHTLGIALSAGERNAEGPYAEIEWLRLARSDDEEPYAAPTIKDILTDVVLEKRPRRALALRGESYVKCPIWPAHDSTLKLSLGFWGEGAALAEIAVVRNGRAPEVLEQRKLTGSERAGWNPIEVSLGRFAGELVGLRFRVADAKGVGRVAFAEPVLFRKRAPMPRVTSPTVVVVVFSGLRRAIVPPWGGGNEMTGFLELVRGGTVFTEYRVPTSIPTGVLATILSGLPPRAHAVEDRSARLSSGVLTVNRALKQASGRAAMFTGVPTSFEAFGFGAEWDEYASFSPVTDAAAHEPLDRAVRWLEDDVKRGVDARRFVLVHARGAHPPWDISKAEAEKLKPDEYTGPLDARRGAIALGNIRSRQRAASRRLDPDDWTRLSQFEEAALAKQDAGLERLMTALKKNGLWDDALLVVAGDVAAGEAPTIPYHPSGPLTEDRLYVPMIVKFPRRLFAGKEVSATATTIDLALTLQEALGLEGFEHAQGVPLAELARGDLPLAGRPVLATLGQEFATRLGPWRLSGSFGNTPELCNLAIDPACINDLLEQRPFVASSLWRWTYLEEKATREMPRAVREPASLDDDTSAALAVWGDM